MNYDYELFILAHRFGFMLRIANHVTENSLLALFNLEASIRSAKLRMRDHFEESKLTKLRLHNFNATIDEFDSVIELLADIDKFAAFLNANSSSGSDKTTMSFEKFRSETARFKLFEQLDWLKQFKFHREYAMKLEKIFRIGKQKYSEEFNAILSEVSQTSKILSFIDHLDEYFNDSYDIFRSLANLMKDEDDDESTTRNDENDLNKLYLPKEKLERLAEILDWFIQRERTADAADASSDGRLNRQLRYFEIRKLFLDQAMITYFSMSVDAAQNHGHSSTKITKDKISRILKFAKKAEQKDEQQSDSAKISIENELKNLFKISDMTPETSTTKSELDRKTSTQSSTTGSFYNTTVDFLGEVHESLNAQDCIPKSSAYSNDDEVSRNTSRRSLAVSDEDFQFSKEKKIVSANPNSDLKNAAASSNSESSEEAKSEVDLEITEPIRLTEKFISNLEFGLNLLLHEQIMIKAIYRSSAELCVSLSNQFAVSILGQVMIDFESYLNKISEIFKNTEQSDDVVFSLLTLKLKVSLLERRSNYYLASQDEQTISQLNGFKTRIDDIVAQALISYVEVVHNGNYDPLYAIPYNCSVHEQTVKTCTILNLIDKHHRTLSEILEECYEQDLSKRETLFDEKEIAERNSERIQSKIHCLKYFIVVCANLIEFQIDFASNQVKKDSKLQVAIGRLYLSKKGTKRKFERYLMYFKTNFYLINNIEYLLERLEENKELTDLLNSNEQFQQLRESNFRLFTEKVTRVLNMMRKRWNTLKGYVVILQGFSKVLNRQRDDGEGYENEDAPAATYFDIDADADQGLKNKAEKKRGNKASLFDMSDRMFRKIEKNMTIFLKDLAKLIQTAISIEIRRPETYKRFRQIFINNMDPILTNLEAIDRLNEVVDRLDLSMTTKTALGAGNNNTNNIKRRKSSVFVKSYKIVIYEAIFQNSYKTNLI